MWGSLWEQAWSILFYIRHEVEAFDVVIIIIILIFHHSISILFDPGSMLSNLFMYFSTNFDAKFESLVLSIYVSLIGDSLVMDLVY